ncbi:putative RNA pol II accessory factor Cdc73 family C terminal [Trypanosoma vivax]|nr:hypothetical protein TRVL_00352 [Trypanosoma vivax]KAH8607912.1 putative RNA pol II accessory factor Cdc73 family C terminal [Trypanosoma vivax]
MSLAREWERLVEQVAAMDSTEPLPPEFFAAEYLPRDQEVPAELLEHIRAGIPTFEAEARATFQSQMTPEEGYHAEPAVSRHISRMVSGGMHGATTGERETSEYKNSGNDDDLINASREEGPNFFEAYKAHATSTAISGDKGAGKKDLALALGGGNAKAANLPCLIGTASRLTSGFLVPEHYLHKHRQLDFTPIILVPASVSSILQLFNIAEFLERGVYVDPPTLFVDPETGAVNVKESKPANVTVSPGSFLDPDKYTVAFRTFRVLDDPRQVKDWKHVCACIVDGKEWQFRDWFPHEPGPIPVSVLFQRVCGFLPYFEEEKLPKALHEWHVQPLALNRRVVKAHAHILQASIFWEHLYTFLDSHEFFRLYSVHAN